MSLIYGVNPVIEALRGRRRPVERIGIALGVRIARFDELMRAAKAANVPIVRQPAAALDRAASGKAHQGVIAWVGAASYASLEDVLGRMKHHRLAILLDGVEDPHNLGAIVRTAECGGAAGVVIPERGAAGLTDVVAKTSAGALEHLPVARVTNLVSAIEAFKESGNWVVGLDGDAPQSCWDYDFAEPTALVFGGEGKGLRRLVREHCDALLSIPLFGSVSSLNVSVSVGVVLFEARRATARRP